MLTDVTVHFERNQKNLERIVAGPLISASASEPFQIRFSYFTLVPHQLPFEQVEPCYRAHDRFERLVRDRANQY